MILCGKPRKTQNDLSKTSAPKLKKQFNLRIIYTLLNTAIFWMLDKKIYLTF